eukprot:Em0004g210a
MTDTHILSVYVVEKNGEGWRAVEWKMAKKRKLHDVKMLTFQLEADDLDNIVLALDQKKTIFKRSKDLVDLGKEKVQKGQLKVTQSLEKLHHSQRQEGRLHSKERKTERRQKEKILNEPDPEKTRNGGDSIFRHNSLRDAFWESCKLACIAGQIEAGSGLDVEGSRTRPADILLPNWEFGKPAALDFTITSALNPSTLNEASVMAGSAASAAEVRKHVANDEKCSRLGWVCIPLSVETYGCWGEEAGRCLDRLATRIATRTGCPKSSAVSGLYGRLSIGLVRANARALLARSSSLS